MVKALFYKEWKKTKFFNICILALGIALLLYIFLKLGRSFRLVGMEHLWDVIINRDQFVFRDLKFFPLAAGICLGFAQFIPELIQKKIKLSLHLPLPEKRIILSMLGFGQVTLICLFIFQIIAILIFTTVFFPTEFVASIMYTIAPWYISGITAYSFIAMICLEPTWKRRIFNVLLMTGTLNLFFLSDFPSSYSSVIYLSAILPILVSPYVLLSIQRFKEGKQD